MKKISELIPSIKNEDFEVTSICNHSGKVSDGSVFFALSGTADDGEKYIDQAISAGAKCIILKGESEFSETKDGVLFVHVEDVRKTLAQAAAVFFDSPNFYDKAFFAAVTGTNGKSSTVDILRQIWSKSGKNAASIGTLGVIRADNSVQETFGGMTSPDAIKLHEIFQKLSHDGVTHVAMEASSHGIHQKRLYGVPFKVLAFTNFSQDHLDYHKTLENYWLAKEALFSECAATDSVFVLNYDDEKSARLSEIADKRGTKRVGYGRKRNCDAEIIDIVPEDRGQKITFYFLGKKISCKIPLFGTFQAYNIMCAALSAYVSGVELDEIIAAIENLKSINGRLEMIAEFHGAKIYIDFAHTPEALKNAILSVKEHKHKRIFTLFGCGGERDQGKRILMGKVSSEFSDVTFVTDDNPRHESPSEIRKMIMEGCRSAIEIPDRKNAIETAVSLLSKGDVLLIAGKGHEDYQITNDGIKKFSDKEVVLNRISK